MLDIKVLNYLKEFKIADTETLTKLFYKNKKYAQRRLLMLYKDKEVDRERDFISQQYRYWIKGNKPRQLKHSLLLTQFHSKLDVQIEYISPAFKIGNVIPDGFLVYKKNGYYYSNFIEIQLNGSADTEKYKHLYHSNIWIDRFNGIFPRVIFITNQNIDMDQDYKIIIIKEDLTNIARIVK